MSKNDTKLFAFLGVFLTIIGYLLVLVARKKDKYANFYAKQGLIIFVVAVALSIISKVAAWIPVIGAIVNWVINILFIGLIVLWVIELIYSLSGKEKKTPLIGNLF